MKVPALEAVQVLTLTLVLDLVTEIRANSFKLTVLHTNDLHSRFDQVTAFGAECATPPRSKCYGGVARIKSVVDDIKRQEPHTVFLNAGDFFQVNCIFGHNCELLWHCRRP